MQASQPRFKIVAPRPGRYALRDQNTGETVIASSRCWTVETARERLNGNPAYRQDSDWFAHYDVPAGGPED